MKKLIVKGIVQGVGFRYYTYEIARKYDIYGYSKNLRDGTVEVVISNDDNENYQIFLNELWIGPHSARVECIEEVEIEDEKFYDFFIRH